MKCSVFIFTAVFQKLGRAGRYSGTSCFLLEVGIERRDWRRGGVIRLLIGGGRADALMLLDKNLQVRHDLYTFYTSMMEQS